MTEADYGARSWSRGPSTRTTARARTRAPRVHPRPAPPREVRRRARRQHRRGGRPPTRSGGSIWSPRSRSYIPWKSVVRDRKPGPHPRAGRNQAESASSIGEQHGRRSAPRDLDLGPTPSQADGATPGRTVGQTKGGRIIRHESCGRVGDRTREDGRGPITHSLDAVDRNRAAERYCATKWNDGHICVASYGIVHTLPVPRATAGQVGAASTRLPARCSRRGVGADRASRSRKGTTARRAISSGSRLPLEDLGTGR